MKRPRRSDTPANRISPSGGTHSPPDEWLRLAVEHSPTAIGIVRGRSFTLSYANAAFRALSGRSAPPGAVMDRPLADAFNAAAARSLTILLERARLSGAPVRARLSADQIGAPGAWRGAAWPASDAAAPPVRRRRYGPMVVAVDETSDSHDDEVRHRDLTELVLLSAIREEARAVAAEAARYQAEQARAAQDRFLADISHDIRTPMQTIMLYTRLIEKGVHGSVSAEQQEALTGIREGARHVIALIGALLQYATRATRVEYVLTRVEVMTAVLAARSIVAPQAREKRIALAVTPGRTGAAVRADAAKLLQVLLNLLDNAVKFTPPRGTISLSWDAVPAEAGRPEQVAIHVADSGRGIAHAELQRVFRPFIRVGESGESGDTSVGLGLAISRDLAQAMGGDLAVASTPDVGSVFTLTLPSS